MLSSNLREQGEGRLEEEHWALVRRKQRGFIRSSFYTEGEDAILTASRQNPEGAEGRGRCHG